MKIFKHTETLKVQDSEDFHTLYLCSMIIDLLLYVLSLCIYYFPKLDESKLQ